MIFLTTIYPSCKQASYYLGVDFKCNFHDQIVYVKDQYEFVYYPITKNGTVLNQYSINLTFQISNINNKYYINTVVRKYKKMCILNPFNLYVDLCGDTYLLDYRQLRQDEVQIQSSVQNISYTSNINTDIIEVLNRIVISIYQTSYQVQCLPNEDNNQKTKYLTNRQVIQCVLNQISIGGNTQITKGYINFVYNVSTVKLIDDTLYKLSSFVGDIPYLQVEGLGDMNGRVQYTLLPDQSFVGEDYIGTIQMYLNPRYQTESPHNLNFSRIGVHTLGWQIFVIGIVYAVVSVVFVIWSIIQQRNSFGGYISQKSK